MTRLEQSGWGGLAGQHPDNELLIRLLDGELIEDEVRLVRSHMSSCPVCRDSYSGWAEVTTDLELFAQSLTVKPAAGARKLLAQSLSGSEEAVTPPVQSARRYGAWRAARISTKTYAWAILAAAVVLAFAIVPREKNLIRSGLPNSESAKTATVDVNGEGFVLLPYSDPELPMNAPRIVEMQVPVSSLVAAGVSVETSANLSPQADRTVLANVLLGIDGQPLGVHVLNTD